MTTDATTTPRLYTVAQFSARHPAWTAAALRGLIYGARERIGARGARSPGNGLTEAGAILRVGRRVLIDEQAFFRWIASQQRPRIAARNAKAAT